MDGPVSNVQQTMHRFSAAILVFLTSTMISYAVDCIPQAQQAARATRIIDAYHGVRPSEPPKKLHVVYFTPADREPVAQYAKRLDAILRDIQDFYRDEMKRLGFGPKTFPMVRDGNGKLVIHLVKGKRPAADYPRTREDRLNGDRVSGARVTDECKPVLDAAGIDIKNETVIIFCNLADWDDKTHTYDHHSPFAGMWNQQRGLCWTVDSPIHNLEFLTRKEPIVHDKVMLQNFGDVPLGKRNSMFIGSFAHELGHAFALPHCGERWDEQGFGKSLMGIGNLTYREERRGDGKGSFLTMASAMKLAARPLFSGSTKGLDDEVRLKECDMRFSANATTTNLLGRHATVHIEGIAKASPAIYGVIAYFDSKRNGQSAYRAPTATAVPDAKGKFAMEVSDLVPCDDGEIRIQFCHVNNGVSVRRFRYKVATGGVVTLPKN
jgi:hypothetical protein